MKKIFLYFGLALISAPVMAQDIGRDNGLLIPKLEVSPTLSFLVPEPDYSSFIFHLTEVNFDKERKRPEINMVAIMEQKKYLKERKKEFDAPLWAVNNNEEGSVLEISQHIGIYGTNTNYNPYTGKTFNAAFEEARPKDFTDRYSPFYRPRYYRPYY